ncbi:hypothetical protein BHM03_00014165 [Ensete ventricosum]|nr:hypothetical protein BHM03_00014165 [Ensete ventricosum]
MDLGTGDERRSPGTKLELRCAPGSSCYSDVDSIFLHPADVFAIYLLVSSLRPCRCTAQREDEKKAEKREVLQFVFEERLIHSVSPTFFPSPTGTSEWVVRLPADIHRGRQHSRQFIKHRTDVG